MHNQHPCFIFFNPFHNIPGPNPVCIGKRPFTTKQGGNDHEQSYEPVWQTLSASNNTDKTVSIKTKGEHKKVKGQILFF